MLEAKLKKQYAAASKAERDEIRAGAVAALEKDPARADAKEVIEFLDSLDAAEEKKIYVKAKEPIHEDNQFHNKGEIFEVGAKRAKSLGKLVVEVKAKKDEKGVLVEITD